MTSNALWAVGHNIAGYLPNPDSTAHYADRADAVTDLINTMADYADTDDEINFDGSDDDTAGMRAVVDSILADDGPDRVTGEWSATIESGDGNRVEFWIMLSA